MRFLHVPTLVPAFLVLLSTGLHAADHSLHAGAAKIDISPPVLPVIRNGGFLEATDDKVIDPLHARAVVLHEKKSDTRIAIAIVDSCMIPRTMCDAIKKDVTAATGIANDHILVAATHTHSAPSVMHYCLGTRADPNYAKFLPPKVVESIVAANEALQPAKAGWAVFDAADFTKTRRWITRSDQVGTDPFGERTVHAMMHPGHQNPNYIGESGPPDPWFSLLSLQTVEGVPLALLGNFSMHYFSGHPGISPDYFGEFSRTIAKRVAPDEPSFVGILSQGTSGDSWRGDYSMPRTPGPTLQEYTAQLVSLATSALQRAEHRHDLPLAIAETRMTLGRRTPDEKRLAWARAKVEEMGAHRPRNRPEVYAEQAIYLHENPREEVVLQAIRLGDLGITAMPNEVYALTGLKVKARSPLDVTINFSLANGAAGYIPPPEQHHLGGYTTWPARTAGLEVEAEPKMTGEILELLEKASGKKRKTYREPSGDFVKAIESQMPALHLRMADMEAGPGHEAGLAYHLPGVSGPGFGGPHQSRSMAFAGGRLRLNDPASNVHASYSISMWIWNGMPTNARPVTGYMFSLGVDGVKSAPGDHLGIGGTHSNEGRLFLFNGNERDELLAGKTPLPLRTWSHVALVRDKESAAIYVNGALEASGPLPPTFDPAATAFIGGRSDNFANFEGRLDEVAIFGRVLTAAEVRAQFAASGRGR